MNCIGSRQTRTKTFLIIYFVVNKSIIYRYSNITIQTFLHISTLLDPRFKDFPMNEGEEHLPTIKQELVKMVESEGSVPYDKPCSNIDSNPPKKTRVSGLYKTSNISRQI